MCVLFTTFLAFGGLFIFGLHFNRDFSDLSPLFFSLYVFLPVLTINFPSYLGALRVAADCCCFFICSIEEHYARLKLTFVFDE